MKFHCSAVTAEVLVTELDIWPKLDMSRRKMWKKCGVFL